jgi:hypothetical protein
MSWRLLESVVLLVPAPRGPGFPWLLQATLFLEDYAKSVVRLSMARLEAERLATAGFSLLQVAQFLRLEERSVMGRVVKAPQA